MSEFLGQNIPEFAYLTATQNTKRYRCIMRFFYEQYQKMNYWLQPEEIWQGVLAYGLLEEYSLEDCQRDLNALVHWKNLNEQHDGTRATTIEEYLKKRFRYMMTPYAIEIERLVLQLEGITGYGGSLQPSKLQELVRYVRLIRWWKGQQTDSEAEEIWDNLITIFKDLNEQAADYIASLNSKKSEELYNTESFLLYKDSVIGYLQNFIQVLQSTAPEIEYWLREARKDQDSVIRFLHQVARAKQSIPTLEELFTAEEWQTRIEDQWANLERWFLPDEKDLSNVNRLEQMAKDTIYRLVRYAVRIQEQGRHGISRKQELEIIGQWFLALDDLNEAHQLAAYAFGLYETRHFHGEHADSAYLSETSIWNTQPQQVMLASRGHQSKQRSHTPQPVVKRPRKSASVTSYLQKKQQEDDLIQQFLERGQVTIAELEEVSRLERQQLLSWVARCLNNKNLQFKTPDGIRIALLGIPKRDTVTLCCEDGDLEMPNFTLFFRKEEPA